MIRNQLWNSSLWSAYRGFFGAFAVCHFSRPRSGRSSSSGDGTERHERQEIPTALRGTRRPVEDAEISDEEWSVFVGKALVWDGAFGDELGKLARHEATLMNAFTKTLQMLLLLQGNRQGEKGSLILEAVALPPKDR